MVWYLIVKARPTLLNETQTNSNQTFPSCQINVYSSSVFETFQEITYLQNVLMKAIDE